MTIEYRAKWVDDNDSDLSDLGEFVRLSKATAPYIDRKLGLLLGEELPEPQYPDDLSQDVSVEEEDAYDTAVRVYSEWEAQPRIVLADVGSRWERMEYECWQPGNNVPPGKPENWAHVSDEEVQAALEREQDGFRRYCIDAPRYDNATRDGAIWALDVLYICQDYERHEDYGNGWGMIGCVVTLVVDGIEVDSASLWGIESDCGDEYRAEVESGLRAELVARLPELADKLSEAAWEMREVHNEQV